jgi:predicted acylesterase/phospholipase RssA
MNSEDGAALILCIDGGGIRGLAPALFLKHLENEAPELLSSFALVAGTSTGGLIAAAVASGDIADMGVVVDIYRDQAAELLNDRGPVRRVLSKPNTPPGFTRTLDHYLAKKRLCDCETPLIVPAFDIQNHRSVFFSSTVAQVQGSSLTLGDVILASTAAPSYLPPHTIETNGYKGLYVDGGVFANDPSQLAIGEARKLFGQRKIRLLSIGCGEETVAPPPANPKRLKKMKDKLRDAIDETALHHALLATQVVDMFLGATTDAARQQSQDELGDNYLRINPVFKGRLPRLNDTSNEAIQRITEAGNLAWHKNSDRTLDFLGGS